MTNLQTTIQKLNTKTISSLMLQVNSNVTCYNTKSEAVEIKTFQHAKFLVLKIYIGNRY